MSKYEGNRIGSTAIKLNVTSEQFSLTAIELNVVLHEHGFKNMIERKNAFLKLDYISGYLPN